MIRLKISGWATPTTVWPRLRRRPLVVRVLAFTAIISLVLVTAADRVFLGVHYVSDVVGGVLFAAGLVTASWAGYHTPRRRSA